MRENVWSPETEARHTFAEIGEAMGISRQAAFQAYRSGIRKLRNSPPLRFHFQDILSKRLARREPARSNYHAPSL